MTKGDKRIPVEVIERGLKDEDWYVRTATMNACQGRTDIPVETIERWLKDKDWCVRTAAMNACQGRTDIPVETIERGLKDGDWRARIAAMNACQGRTDIPIEVIERGLKDDDYDVRIAAMTACRGRTDIPFIRSFEPPETVYKKCLGGVIVCAHIPDDAQVRGEPGMKCRASKAIITDILGDLCGEKVGISGRNKTTAYFVGDVVNIDNFDLSDEECSTGYHFFCTVEEAQNYKN